MQKHLEKRFKKKDKKEQESWNDHDILFEWYEENKQDPWSEVISALESYDSSKDEIIKKIKEKIHTIKSQVMSCYVI